jgi:hypothetical protein
LLENPLSDVERDALIAAGKLDRYIPVEPIGPWGFLDAVHELFRRTGKSAADIKRFGGRPEWFQKQECFRRMAMDTRQAAAAVRIFLQQGIDEGIMQMRLDGGMLEDCEAELHLLADFVRAQAHGLRATWPDMMRDTVLPTTANPGPRPR